MVVYYCNPSTHGEVEIERPRVQGQEEQDQKGGERRAWLYQHSLAVWGLWAGPQGDHFQGISALCADTLPQNNVITNLFEVK